MEEQRIERTEELGVDLKRIFAAVWSKAGVVMLVACLCAVLFFVGTLFLVTPTYESSAVFYVNNSSQPAGNTVGMTSSDLSTSRNLVKSYLVILRTRESLNEIIESAGISCTPDRLKKMISAAAINETEMFEVVVTSDDPQEAMQIITAISAILPERIANIIDGTSARVVDSAVLPTSPSSPSYPLNTAIGFALGFALSVCVIVLREIFDITIRSEEDVMQCSKHPILTAVPDMLAPTKGGSYYSSDSKRKKKGGAYATKQTGKQSGVMGKEISFAATEAYKMLRTKLQFSFAGDDACRVIALSSSLSGEGKSLTAVNLAHTLSQLDKKVILVDCDMRRPTLAEKLGILKAPGLSNYLTGQSRLDDLLQLCNLKGDERAFHVITAGQNPPNPVELLSSERMKLALKTLRQYYDYVILDMPPVGEVTDAMAVANEVDGMLLVVRQNYCNRLVLADTIRQFEFINTKILGIVVNCTVEANLAYGKKYYKRYYRSYGSSYANNDRSVSSHPVKAKAAAAPRPQSSKK